MSTTVLITIEAVAEPDFHAAIIEAVRQRSANGWPRHEVWAKKYSWRGGPDDLCLGSCRDVGRGDGIHDEYAIGSVEDLLRAVADQTRLRVLIAGAMSCTVTVSSIDDAPNVTLISDGSEDC